MELLHESPRILTSLGLLVLMVGCFAAANAWLNGDRPWFNEEDLKKKSKHEKE